MNILTKLLSALAIVGTLGLTSCTDDSENLYAGYRAFFRYPLVITTQPLRTALDNPGMFCTIRYDARSYYFVGADGTTASQSRTALDNYGAPMCIAGFIVGTPSIPDMQSGMHSPVAYDLACPACYTENAIERSLVFSDNDATGSKVACGRCHRIYDLNNSGILIEGSGPARKLFRYRMSYAAAQGTLVIQN